MKELDIFSFLKVIAVSSVELVNLKKRHMSHSVYSFQNFFLFPVHFLIPDCKRTLLRSLIRARQVFHLNK